MDWNEEHALKRNAEDFVKEMTLEEKVSLLSGVASMDIASVERLGIHGITMADGPHGVRIEAAPEEDCTCFPCLAALGASWNREAAYAMGAAIAEDCIHHGKGMILGPGVNMKRIDLCGRNFEYFSEDPVLSGELAAAYISGVQSKGIGTSLKHYAVNNQEIDRLFVNVELDERTLREVYLKPFEIAVKKGKPASLMCALNKVNGVLCSENKFLLSDILREEWGFEGFVMSDWGCVKDVGKAVEAGLDLSMPYRDGYIDSMKKALEAGTVTMEAIDRSAVRIIDFLIHHQPAIIGYDRERQHEIAQQLAEESIVLLKNEQDILPLTAGKHKKIVVIGEYAERPVIGGYSSSRVFVPEERIDSPLEKLRACLPDVEIEYIQLYSMHEFPERSPHNSLNDLKAIEDADAIVMFAGRQKSVETEGTDRVTSHIDPYYEFFLNRIYLRNKNIILVLQSGSAVLPLNWQNKVKGIVMMWHGGEAAGAAIANVLCGKVNPSGKLSETFPLKTRTDLDYPGDGYKVCYDEKWAIGYRYYDRHPDEAWFPFGYGLSYTSFVYRDLVVEETENGFCITCKVKNTGSVAGKEVVQLYISDRISTVSKPEKELKDFVKVQLEPGEEKKVTFSVKDEQLSYYNLSLKKWIVEPGTYDLLVGASSRDIRLQGTYVYDKGCEYTLNYTAEEIMG